MRIMPLKKIVFVLLLGAPLFWFSQSEQAGSQQAPVSVQFEQTAKSPTLQEVNAEQQTQESARDVVQKKKELVIVEVMATGYTAGYESTGKHRSHPQYGITFSGVKVRRDTYSTIAADPRVFPLGTILFIPGYGYGVVADTGSAIKGRKIDLYYETVREVYEQWGKKRVAVQVIRYGDGSLTEQDMAHLNDSL